MQPAPKSTIKIEKVFEFQVAAITLILLLSNFSSAWGQRQPVARGNLREPMCQPVARIIKGDIRLTAGSQACKEDHLQPANGTTVEVLCYGKGNILQLKSGIIDEQCSLLSNNQAQVCIREKRFNCFRTKGPEEDENTPTLITPYNFNLKSSPYAVLDFCSQCYRLHSANQRARS